MCFGPMFALAAIGVLGGTLDHDQEPDFPKHGDSVIVVIHGELAEACSLRLTGKAPEGSCFVKRVQVYPSPGDLVRFEASLTNEIDDPDRMVTMEMIFDAVRCAENETNAAAAGEEALEFFRLRQKHNQENEDRFPPFFFVSEIKDVELKVWTLSGELNVGDPPGR